jgi:hypothetical protein
MFREREVLYAPGSDRILPPADASRWPGKTLLFARGGGGASGGNGHTESVTRKVSFRDSLHNLVRIHGDTDKKNKHLYLKALLNAYLHFNGESGLDISKKEKRKLYRLPDIDRLLHIPQHDYGRNRMRSMAAGFGRMNDEDKKRFGGRNPFEPFSKDKNGKHHQNLFTRVQVELCLLDFCVKYGQELDKERKAVLKGFFGRKYEAEIDNYRPEGNGNHHREVTIAELAERNNMQVYDLLALIRRELGSPWFELQEYRAVRGKEETTPNILVYGDDFRKIMELIAREKMIGGTVFRLPVDPDDEGDLRGMKLTERY